MLTFVAWDVWLSALAECLDEVRDALHEARPDLALLVERAFDAEHFRLDPGFWIEGDSLALCAVCDGTGLVPDVDELVDCARCRRGFVYVD